jgi:hypothetical protein
MLTRVQGRDGGAQDGSCVITTSNGRLSPDGCASWRWLGMSGPEIRPQRGSPRKESLESFQARAASPGPTKQCAALLRSPSSSPNPSEPGAGISRATSTPERSAGPDHASSDRTVTCVRTSRLTAAPDPSRAGTDRTYSPGDPSRPPSLPSASAASVSSVTAVRCAEPSTAKHHQGFSKRRWKGARSRPPRAGPPEGERQPRRPSGRDRAA